MKYYILYMFFVTSASYSYTIKKDRENITESSNYYIDYNINLHNRISVINLAKEVLVKCIYEWQRTPERIANNYKIHSTSFDNTKISEQEINNPIPILNDKINALDRLFDKIIKRKFTKPNEFVSDIEPHAKFVQHRAKFIFRAMTNSNEWFHWF